MPDLNIALRGIPGQEHRIATKAQMDPSGDAVPPYHFVFAFGIQNYTLEDPFVK